MTHEIDPRQGTPPPLTSLDVSEDHGMEMLARAVVLALIAVLGLSLLVLAWRTL